MDSLREQWLILISTPVYLVFIGLELFLSHLKKQNSYSWKDSMTNLYFMLLNSGLDLLFRAVYLMILLGFYKFRIFEIDNVICYWLVLLITEDFMYYWLHRFDHQIRIFWAVHVTHHSSEEMNLSVGFRSSVFQPVYRFIYFIPLALIGFKPLDIIFVYAVTQIWGILVHTKFINRLGWLEYILVTPSHHRVHHASNPLYLDKNMGMFLIIWDKMFGTFQEEVPVGEYSELKYGLTTPLENKGAFGLVFHEWIQIFKDVIQPDLSLRERWLYIVGPPGYSHDGSRKTSHQLRQLEKTNNPIKN